MSFITDPSTSDPPRILARADCTALFERIAGMRTSAWDFTLTLRSTWSLYFRWGRNRPTSSGSTTDQTIVLTSHTGTGPISATVTDVSDNALTTLVRTMEQRVVTDPPPSSPLGLLSAQHYVQPAIWDEATYQTTMQMLSDAARQSVEGIRGDTLVSAGYTEVGAASWAVYNTNGLAAYAAVTGASYSETVRAMDGTASGWAGQRTLTWARLDPVTLSHTAHERCLASANPVAVEPGRYTAILSPDMVISMVYSLMGDELNRAEAEQGGTVFSGPTLGTTKLGTQVIDARLTLTSDPMDPDCGFIPFDPDGNPYRPVTWIENGVLKALAYGRKYAYYKFGTAVALPNPRAFRLNGGPTATMSVEAMIAATERGILVTLCGTWESELTKVLPVTSVTRNGLWLIDQGKISRPIKNMWFTESPMIILNKVLHIGPTVLTHGADALGGSREMLRDLPARAVCDGRTVLAAPALTVQDFNFTRLTDAI